MKDVPFPWGENEEGAFKSLKTALTSTLVLALLWDEGWFWLETDTSDVVTSAVLSQEQEDGSF
jgi:hypothetical protein